MSYFMYGGKLTYPDYLLAQGFVDEIKSESQGASARVSLAVSDQTRQIVASDEALARENIREMHEGVDRLSGHIQEGLGRVAEKVEEGFQMLSYEIGAVSQGIDNLTAKFHWGFGQMLASQGRMNDSLSALVSIAKTPAQTAAYEHYEIARDAFRQGLYAECLESLDRATNGDHTSSGYKLEWRFHQLKGTVHLGFVGCDTGLVDLTKAEESFLMAARYAKADFPSHAAQGLLSAGWAAYCQGKMRESLIYTEQAISADPDLAEALFQCAKVSMAVGNVDGALTFLQKLIEKDSFYIIKIAGDEDFKKNINAVNVWFDSLRVSKIKETFRDFEKFIKWEEIEKLSSDMNTDDALCMLAKQIISTPLLDILGCQDLFTDKCRILLRAIKINPIVVMQDGFAVKCKVPHLVSSIQEESYIVFEQQPFEEEYLERIIIRKGGLFCKEISELRTQKRIVMKDVETQKMRYNDIVTEEYEFKDYVSKKMQILSSITGGVITEIEFCYVPETALTSKDGTTNSKNFHAFYISRYPITQKQWIAVMDTNPSYFQNENGPVESVSQKDCYSFLHAVGHTLQGWALDLPTVEEWAYVSSFSYDLDDWSPKNSSKLLQVGWFTENSKKPVSVGLKVPNSLGVFDLHGNVYEWCAYDGFAYCDAGGSHDDSARDWLKIPFRTAHTDGARIDRGFRPVLHIL